MALYPPPLDHYFGCCLPDARLERTGCAPSGRVKGTGFLAARVADVAGLVDPAIAMVAIVE
jgi:hypothetical protein